MKTLAVLLAIACSTALAQPGPGLHTMMRVQRPGHAYEDDLTTSLSKTLHFDGPTTQKLRAIVDQDHERRAQLTQRITGVLHQLTQASQGQPDAAQHVQPLIEELTRLRAELAHLDRALFHRIWTGLELNDAQKAMLFLAMPLPGSAAQPALSCRPDPTL